MENWLYYLDIMDDLYDSEDTENNIDVDTFVIQDSPSSPSESSEDSLSSSNSRTTSSDSYRSVIRAEHHYSRVLRSHRNRTTRATYENQNSLVRFRNGAYSSDDENPSSDLLENVENSAGGHSMDSIQPLVILQRQAVRENSTEHLSQHNRLRAAINNSPSTLRNTRVLTRSPSVPNLSSMAFLASRRSSSHQNLDWLGSNDNTAERTSLGFNTRKTRENRTLSQESRSDEPPAKLRKIDNEDKDNGNCCPICLEMWTSGGEHRLTSLKCGHLFGESCIKTWLSKRNSKYCPSCKEKASIKDFRPIFASALAWVDNSEVQALKEKLDAVMRDKERQQQEIEALRVCQSEYLKKIDTYRLLEEKINIKSLEYDEACTHKTLKFRQSYSVDVTKTGECRVFAFHSESKTLYVSQSIQNNLFPGYAITRLDCETRTLGRPVHLHTKEIRAIAYSPKADFIMSASLDKHVKMITHNGDKESMSVLTEAPIWSCCWDSTSPFRFYTGCVNGVILLYDMRQTKSCLSRIVNSNDKSPVISLDTCSLGLISCQLNSVNFHKKSLDSGFVTTTLSTEGPFSGLVYDENTKHIVTTTRPSVNQRHCLHTVGVLDQIGCTLSKVHQFIGSDKQSFMSKSGVFTVNNHYLYTAYNERLKTINVWNVNKMTGLPSLSNQNVVLDMCHLEGQSHDLHRFASLTKNTVQIYNIECV